MLTLIARYDISRFLMRYQKDSPKQNYLDCRARTKNRKSSRVAMCSRLYVSLLSILILSGARAMQPFDEDILPAEVSRRLDDYWRAYKVTCSEKRGIPKNIIMECTLSILPSLVKVASLFYYNEQSFSQRARRLPRPSSLTRMHTDRSPRDVSTDAV